MDYILRPWKLSDAESIVPLANNKKLQVISEIPSRILIH